MWFGRSALREIFQKIPPPPQPHEQLLDLPLIKLREKTAEIFVYCEKRSRDVNVNY